MASTPKSRSFLDVFPNNTENHAYFIEHFPNTIEFSSKIDQHINVPSKINKQQWCLLQKPERSSCVIKSPKLMEFSSKAYERNWCFIQNQQQSMFSLPRIKRSLTVHPNHENPGHFTNRFNKSWSFHIAYTKTLTFQQQSKRHWKLTPTIQTS